MNQFFSGFASELVKMAAAKERKSALSPLAATGGTLGSLIGLISSSKGKRIARTLKGGGIGALAGAGAGAATDTIPEGDVTIQADRDVLMDLFGKSQKVFEPKKWGKVWV